MKGLSPANEASIAFIWEHEGHRILFMGDANPDQVVKKSGMFIKIPQSLYCLMPSKYRIMEVRIVHLKNW